MIASEHKIPILSFYSGGGFMDMGFQQAGFVPVWSNEFDSSFAKMNQEGMGSWKKANGIEDGHHAFDTRSVTDINTSEILQNGFPSGVPEIFGMIGGPPCQDFTINGKMEGFAGERGKLTAVYLEKVLELKPTFFIMENVTGLIRNVGSKAFLFELLKKVGKKYLIDYSVLNALDFGVPQSRERVFFVGLRKKGLTSKMIAKALDGPWFPFPLNEKYHGAETKFPWSLVSDFGGQPIKPEKLPIELCVEDCLVKEGEEAITANANEYFNFRLPPERLMAIKEGETTRPSFKRLHRYRYSPTACYGNNEVHLHPYLNRRLSVRETLRIQGVPDEYQLSAEVPMTKKFKMIGNGVPVPLARAMAEAMAKFLHSTGVLVRKRKRKPATEAV